MSLATLEFYCPPSKWQGLRRALAAKGVDVPDALAGEINHDGVIVAWRRDGDKLTVDLIKRPFKYKFFPLSVIVKKVKELFEQV